MKLISSSIYASIDVVLKDVDDSMVYDIRALPGGKRRKIQILKDDKPTAYIELHSMKADVFTIHDQAVIVDPKKRVFTASNGNTYAWLASGDDVEMRTADSLDAPPLVVYKAGWRSASNPHDFQPAVIEVSDTLMSILDEVIATYVYISRLENERANGRASFWTALGNVARVG